MKNVCFVLASPLSVNAFLQSHLHALADRYHVSLCVNTENSGVQLRIDPRVEVLHLDIRRPISPLRDLFALLALWRLFRRRRFDLVHSLTPKAGLLAMVAACVARVPNRVHIFTGQVWVTRSGVSRSLFRQIDRLIARCATVVMADSDSQRRFLEAEGVVNQGITRVAGHGSVCGVDSQRFRPDPQLRAEVRAALGVPPEACVFLFLGRINRDKGVLDLATAFAELGRSRPDAWLWMVGPDEECLRSEMACILGPSAARVCWVGSTTEPERYFSAADVLTLPSYREGFGAVVIEAAAAGIPAIASRIYGLIDAVEEGLTGLLFPAGDAAGLGAMMKILLDQPGMRGELGARARERALRDFSPASLGQAWCDLYAGLLP
ncbi:MAG: glycosyltransferase [Rhodocyclaceae bacterium]|nr:MAG: glycosyltransferase [Rhodocyclaceae bacterium]